VAARFEVAGHVTHEKGVFPMSKRKIARSEKQVSASDQAPVQPPSGTHSVAALDIHDGELPTCAYEALGARRGDDDSDPVMSMLKALASDLRLFAVAVEQEAYDVTGDLVGVFDRTAARVLAIRETYNHQHNRRRNQKKGAAS
jgi:hypothetical protein